MKIMRRRLILVVLICVASALVAYTQEKSIDEYIEGFRIDVGAASVSVALVNENGITWKGAFGKANIESGSDATTRHIYGLGSVSKLYTGAAFMKLYEQGKVKLDADVNDYLPFEVRNPKFPDTPITFRMLMTHTSSIGDYQELQNKLYSNGDPDMSLKEVTEKFFNSKGEYYRTENYMDFKPGSSWDYSNWNFVLLGYVIESLSGEPFNQYCRKVIMDPLEMKEAAWLLKNLNEEKSATLYRKNETGEFTPLNYFSWPGYSDGSLHTSVEEAANFLIMTINKGEFEGKQILKQETIAEMLKPNAVENLPPGFLKDMGLVWHIAAPMPVYLHTGEPTGTIIAMLYNPQTNSGFVTFITGINFKIPGNANKWVGYLMYLVQQSSGLAESNAN